MTDSFEEGERFACPICKDETFGRPCETSYCAGYEAGRLAAVRADVERHVVACDQDIEALAEFAIRCPSDADVARVTALVASGCARDAADCRKWLEATS